MSAAALLEHATVKTADKTSLGLGRPRSAFPVGARFPRRIDADPSATPAIVVTSAPIFPIGARFPRRTVAEVLAYLAELELRGAPVATTDRTYPVGARFPLR